MNNPYDIHSESLLLRERFNSHTYFSTQLLNKADDTLHNLSAGGADEAAADGRIAVIDGVPRHANPTALSVAVGQLHAAPPGSAQEALIKIFGVTYDDNDANRETHEPAASQKSTVSAGKAVLPSSSFAAAPLPMVPSLKHISKLDVIFLREALEQRCQLKNARAFGVCEIREELHQDALNEIIRQVTIVCPERGLLLAELRDEHCETQRTYDMLTQAAAQYGARKGLERDISRTMQTDLVSLTKDVHTLENRVNEIKAKYDGMCKHHQERREADERKHETETAFIKKNIQQLINEIKRLNQTS